MVEQFRERFNNFPFDPSDVSIQNFGNRTPPVNRRTKTGKSLAICVVGAVIIITAAFLIFNLTGGTAENVEYSIPEGGRLAGGYVSENIPDAPNVYPDPDGPQIKVTDGKSDVSNKNDASGVYKKVSPSVVCITSYEGGKDYVLDSTGGGSGIILTEDGYIATNSHVVNDSSKTGVMVTLSDKSEYLGTIVGIDVKTDLALLKIDADGLTPAKFADSKKVTVGQQVFAIGTPADVGFLNSLTEGTVSAVERLLSSNYVKYIQTDAAINPGNSGGALADEYGRVIGMNTAKIVSSGYDNMGFAIPSDTIIEVINELIKYGKVVNRGALLINCKDCTLYMSKASKVPQGVIIKSIENGSPLKKTQVQKNDIITAINDVEIKSTIDLVDELKKYKPGDDVKLTLYRADNKSNGNGYIFDVSVNLVFDSRADN